MLNEGPRKKQSTIVQRRRNRACFATAVQTFKSRATGGTASDVPYEPAPLSVVVRKRPLFDHETALHDWDAITCGGDIDDDARGGAGISGTHFIWAHKGGLRLDAKHMFMEHHGFPFDAIFDESCEVRGKWQRGRQRQVPDCMAVRVRRLEEGHEEERFSQH